MFCTRCGHEQPDNAAFCTQCGTRFIAEKSVSDTPKAAPPMSQQAYFASHCLAVTKRRRKVIKVLSIVSLAIQGMLAVLVTIAIIKLHLVLAQHPFGGDGSSVILSNIIPVVISTAISIILTLQGLKKNSTGFFVSATILAFLSATFSAGLGINSLGLRRLVVFGTLAIYIVITVLNHRCNKEYKNYLIKQEQQM